MNLSQMNIAQIAGVIQREWVKVNYAAKPYLDAMFSLDNINDVYPPASDGRSVVAYFLCNASQFKGDVAKAVKAELRARLAK